MRYSMYTDPDIYCSRGREVANAGTGSTRRIYFFSGRASVPLVANKKKKSTRMESRGLAQFLLSASFENRPRFSLSSLTMFVHSTLTRDAPHFRQSGGHVRLPTFYFELSENFTFYILVFSFHFYFCFIYTHTNINIR